MIIHAHIDHLCSNLSQSISDQKILNVGVTVLAFTTDTVCKIAFDGPPGYLEDYKAAKEWHDTIAAIAKMTTLLKQFPWLLGIAMKMPVSVIELLSPALARLLKLHSVSPVSVVGEADSV